MIDAEDVLSEMKKLGVGGHIIDITSTDGHETEESRMELRGFMKMDQTWGVVDADGR